MVISLLTEDEESLNEDAFGFDLELLAGRLLHALHWIRYLSAAKGLPLGLLAAGPGAAAAFKAGCNRVPYLEAMVCCGGDMEETVAWTGRIKPATLFILSEYNFQETRAMHRFNGWMAYRRSNASTQGMGDFEMAWGREKASDLAISWFRKHLIRKG